MMEVMLVTMPMSSCPTTRRVMGYCVPCDFPAPVSYTHLVWGGSSPATSFDCSGFVSWVINHSGWNVGRLGAQGLYNICAPTSSPKPGDLVFFVGTYDTAGVSHLSLIHI